MKANPKFGSTMELPLWHLEINSVQALIKKSIPRAVCALFCTQAKSCNVTGGAAKIKECKICLSRMEDFRQNIESERAKIQQRL